jgi:hypothetical protein
VGQKTGGATKSRSNVEHDARGSKTEMFRRSADGVRAVIMPLIQRKQLLRIYCVARSDTKSSKSPFYTIDVRIKRHRLDRSTVTHGSFPALPIGGYANPDSVMGR